MIIIDFREKEIISQCNLLLNGRDIKIETTNLLLGDIKIGDKLLIERKSINDLAASIVDGRYKEQSFRLEKALEEGYNVFYFIEGNMDLYTGSISKNTLVSAIYSLTHKRFQVLLTKNSKETAFFILQFAEKMIKRIKNKTNTNTKTKTKINKSIVSDTSTSTNTNADVLVDATLDEINEIPKTYENTEGIVQTKKNKNITKDNISVFMLCQIPGISIATAAILLKKYGHISKLIIELNKNPNEIEEFEYESNSNSNLGNTVCKTKLKKLNKNIIKNLKEYLYIN